MNKKLIFSNIVSFCFGSTFTATMVVSKGIDLNGFIPYAVSFSAGGVVGIFMTFLIVWIIGLPVNNINNIQESEV